MGLKVLNIGFGNIVSAGRIVAVISPSSAPMKRLKEDARARGKVVELLPDIRHSISYTTRPPRVNEIDGVDYHFVSEEIFVKMVERDEFVEWAIVHGNRYGTAEKSLKRYEAEGIDIILDIDVQGAGQIRQKLKRGVYIFVLPPDPEELEKRLRGRGTEGNEVIKARLLNAREEIGRIGN